MDILIFTLASLAAKLADPLFLVAAPALIILVVRQWWIAACATVVTVTTINVAMVWSWWGELGIPVGLRAQHAVWLLVVWSLWAVIAALVAWPIRSYSRKHRKQFPETPSA